MSLLGNGHSADTVRQWMAVYRSYDDARCSPDDPWPLRYHNEIQTLVAVRDAVAAGPEGAMTAYVGTEALKAQFAIRQKSIQRPRRTRTLSLQRRAIACVLRKHPEVRTVDDFLALVEAEDGLVFDDTEDNCSIEIDGTGVRFFDFATRAKKTATRKALAKAIQRSLRSRDK